jgi:uncharacterized membrane protein
MNIVFTPYGWEERIREGQLSAQLLRPLFPIVEDLGSFIGWKFVVILMWLPIAAVLTAGAFFAFQRSLQGASPVTAIALMTAGTYVTSIVGGLVLLDDPLGSGTALSLVHAAALAVVVGAAWLLSRSQAELALAPEVAA